jgi:hypothetical protein
LFLFLSLKARNRGCWSRNENQSVALSVPALPGVLYVGERHRLGFDVQSATCGECPELRKRLKDGLGGNAAPAAAVELKS